MAAPTNAHKRVAIVHNIPDIRDVIYMVDPDETPGITNFGRAQATNTTHQWQEDVYDTATTANAFPDGDAFAPQAVNTVTVLTNECQISRKDFTITRRARKVNKAGPDDELARQIGLKGTALRRDMESIIFNNQAKVLDNGTAAPLLAGLPAWIAGTTDGRADRGGTGTDPTGDGTDAAGDGTARALTESGLLDIITAIYGVSSVRPNCTFMHHTIKQKFSTFLFSTNARVATQYQDQGANPRGGVQVVGAVDTWVTDFGVLDIVPDRFQRQRDVFVKNTSWIDVADFDPMSVATIGRRSDTDERMIVSDYTLVPRNRSTLGVYADVDNVAVTA